MIHISLYVVPIPFVRATVRPCARACVHVRFLARACLEDGNAKVVACHGEAHRRAASGDRERLVEDVDGLIVAHAWHLYRAASYATRHL